MGEELLVGGDTFFVLDHLPDALEGVTGRNVEDDGFAGQRLDKDLHVRDAVQVERQ